MKNLKNKIKELTNKQKVIASVAAIALVLLMIGTVVLLQEPSKKSNIELKKEVYTLEFGQKYSTKKEDYVKAEKEILKKTTVVIDGKDIDSFSLSKGKRDFLEKYSVGKYKGVITYKDEKLKFVVEIKDTVAPQFEDFKDSIEIEQNKSDVKYEDYFTAKDLSEVTISVDSSKVNLTLPGTYEINVTATDKYKNKTSKKSNVIVIEKKEEAEIQSETDYQTNNGSGTGNNSNGSNQGTSGGSSTNNDSGGNTGNGSGSTGGSSGGNTGGGSTTPPPPANVCDQPIGNSNRWFGSQSDANNYGYTILSDFNQPYNDFTTWGNDICGYTVHFS